MPRSEGKTYITYSFGCLPPTKNEDVMLDQMRRRVEFWNKMVEIEDWYNEEVAKIMHSETKEKIDELNKELVEIRKEIKEKRMRERTGKVDISELKIKAEDIKTQMKVLKQQLKVEQEEIYNRNQQKLMELGKIRKEKIKKAQKESGLYWGNYEEVLRNFESARKKSKREKGKLKLRQFDGTGKITVRFQSGLSIKELYSCKNRSFQIEPVDRDAWYSPIRAIRRKKSRTVARLRVQSFCNDPIFVELPIVLHREIPENATIKTASIIREKVGRRFRYKLNIVLELPEEYFSKQTIKKEGTATIRFGWHNVDEGLCVAQLVDDKGYEENLILTHDVLYEFNKLKELQSIRDNLFNEIVQKFLELVESLKIPTELSEKIKDLYSQQKLYDLYTYWKENRIIGDDKIIDLLEKWSKKELHYYDWQANLRDQVLRRRREIYRIFASKITKKYATIILQDLDLKNLSKKPDPEEGTSGSLPYDYNRYVASIGQLRNCIIQAGIKNGTKIDFMPSSRD